jgi:hypothetical protein
VKGKRVREAMDNHVYLPHQVAEHMCLSKQPLEGMTPRATQKNYQVHRVVTESISEMALRDTVGLQHVGSRVKGYCNEDSDVDLYEIVLEGSTPTVKHELDTILSKAVGVHCLHSGDDLMTDLEDVFTLTVSPDYESFRSGIIKEPGIYVPLLEQGVFFGDEQRLARAALLLVLFGDMSETEALRAEMEIKEKYNQSYVDGNSLSGLQTKLAERYSDHDLEELFWDAVMESGSESIIQLYSSSDDSEYFNYDPDIFINRIMQSLPYFFSQRLLEERRRRYGMSWSLRDLLQVDLNIIGNGLCFSDCTMFECYSLALQNARGLRF